MSPYNSLRRSTVAIDLGSPGMVRKVKFVSRNDL